MTAIVLTSKEQNEWPRIKVEYGCSCDAHYRNGTPTFHCGNGMQVKMIADQKDVDGRWRDFMDRNVDDGRVWGCGFWIQPNHKCDDYKLNDRLPELVWDGRELFVKSCRKGTWNHPGLIPLTVELSHAKRYEYFIFLSAVALLILIRLV